MKNKVLILIVLIVIFLVGSLLYFKFNPPLHFEGHSANAEQASGDSPNTEVNPFVIVANPVNEGFADIKIKEVLVNSYDKPKKVELGVSRSNWLVLVSEAVGDPSEGISFHEIEDYPIKKSPKNKYEDGDIDTIRHYGIAIFHDEEITKIIVKYSYLGFPFEKVMLVHSF
jgi:hypothetical protein